MIRQSGDVVYLYDAGLVCRYLPDQNIYRKTHDHKEWLLSRTKKRLKRMGYETELKRIDVLTIKEYRINSEKISDIICEMCHNLRRLFMEPHCLLLGPIQFDSLIRESYSTGWYGSFHVETNIRNKYGSFLGIDVKVVPGIDMPILIPKQVLK